MKLSKRAIKEIKVRVKNRLALELDCSVQTVERWIKNNESDNDLTKATALNVISEETGLKYSEILEDDFVTEEQK